MKTTDLIKLMALTLSFPAVIVLPFLPGPPNTIVQGLSVLAQSAGFFGLVLVPVGAIWTIVELLKRRKGADENQAAKVSFRLALISLTVAAIIGLLLTLYILVNLGWLTGLIVLMPVAYGIYWAIGKLRRKFNPTIEFNPAPLYLMTIPLISLFARIYLMPPLSDYSRSIAIARGHVFIEAIEEFKRTEGQYPPSLKALSPGYLEELPGTSVMGAGDFRYNKINQQYTLSFSQWLEVGFLEEIVLYDKDNLKNNLSGEFAKYDYQFDLCRVKGAFTTRNHGQWRSYLLD